MNKLLFKMMIENLVIIQQAGYTLIRDIKTQALSNLSYRDRKLELAGIILPERNPREELPGLERNRLTAWQS